VILNETGDVSAKHLLHPRSPQPASATNMPPSERPKTVLFVDDETSIRLTLATILRQSGFEVTVAATVAEALREINTQYFDALISDLNIGEPGDGFTVVSAMRRTQPTCINLILTGYPAFETALQAIRNQVDDYLVKPAKIEELVASLHAKLENPRNQAYVQLQTVAKLLREHVADLQCLVLAAAKSGSRLATLPLSDEQRVCYVPDVVTAIVNQLEAERPSEPTEGLLIAGAQHGATRRAQGYSQQMLVDDIRLLDSSIHDTIQGALLKIDVSNLIPNLKQVNATLACYLQESLEAFNTERAA
jgi:DNA-binding response OmpR family regulator